MKIKPRGSGFTMLVWVGSDPETGKDIVKRVSGKTESEVKAKALDLQAKYHRSVDSGLPMVDAGRITVGEFLDLWLQAPGLDYRPNSLHTHEAAVRAWKATPVGSMRIASLTSREIDLARRQWKDRGLAPRTINQRLTTLRRALAKAVEWRKMDHNPAAAVEPARKRRTEFEVWDGESVHRFIEATAGDELRGPLYRLALHTGMRQGELIGLRWCYVDLTSRLLRVERFVEDYSGGIVSIGDTKTDGSRRTIRLNTSSVAALREQRDRKAFRFRALGAEPGPDTPAFDDGVGEIMKPRTLRKSYTRAVRRAGLRHIPFHCLRHAAATHMLAQGDKPHVVAKMLGHTDPAVTLRYYAHVLDGMEAEAAASLDRAYGYI